MTFYCDGEEEKGDVDNTSFLSFVQIFLEELYAKILQNYICTGTSSILTYNYFYYPIFEITISFEIVSEIFYDKAGRKEIMYLIMYQVDLRSILYTNVVLKEYL